MKKLKLIQKLTLVTLVGLMVFGLSTGALGANTEKIRPIEEWGEVNPFLGVWFVWPRLFFAYDWYGELADPDTTYDGFILEKENSDGSLDVKVNLFIHNVPMGVLEWQMGLIFMGAGELHFYTEFTMDNGYYGIELPTLDNLIENYTFGIHGQLKSMHFVAYGSGVYFIEDVSAKLTFKGLGLVKPDLRDDHPLRGIYPIIWPGEFIKIHTI
ncbi:MAG: hypothetical protein ACFE9V_05605 [Candidatus Hodarchaeota archaeon]